MKRSTRSVSSQEDSFSVEEQQVTSYQKKKGKKLPSLCRPSQWVAVIPEGTRNAQGYYSLVPLTDPKTGLEQRYLVCEEKCLICEAQTCSDEPRSWFIGDTVQTDGSLLVCTPVDPLFLALPYLARTAEAGKFTTLEAILDDPVHRNVSILERYVPAAQWQHVSDVKSLPGDVLVYRYNPDKTMKWLRRKVEAVSSELQAQKVHVGSGSCSATLVRSLKQESVSKERYLHYACGIVCEYLNEAMTTILSQEYSLKDTKRRVQQELADEPEAKRQRTESLDSGIFSQQNSECDSEAGSHPSSQELSCTPIATSTNGHKSEDGPIEDYTKYNASLPPVASAVKKMSRAQKALAKADKKGMKSLSSFFGRTKT